MEKLFIFPDMFDMYKRKLAIMARKVPHKWVFQRIEKPDNYVILKKEKSRINLR